MLDIRSQFPIFVSNTNLVYLDSASSAQKPQVVIDAMRRMMEASYANVHRGLYPLSEQATEMYEAAREKVRGFIGARNTKEIIFTKNATEAINLVAYSWAMDNIHKGDVIVVTEMEHHSNLLPWLMVAERVGALIEYIPVHQENHKLHITKYKEIIGKYQNRIKLVAVSHVSNVLGTINPIKEIVTLARGVNARVMVDGCQAVAHLPVDVLDLDVDFYAFSGHKLYGPTGIGVLYAKRDHLEYMHPFLRGGEMVLEANGLGRNVWKELPWKFEAGTPPIVEAIGLGVAIDFVMSVGFDVTHDNEQELSKVMLEKLTTIDGLRILGPLEVAERIGVFSFVVNGVHPHDIAHVLGEKNVCVRAGHHCAQPLHKNFQLEATTRASFGVYTSHRDIDLFIEALQEAISLFTI